MSLKDQTITITVNKIIDAINKICILLPFLSTLNFPYITCIPNNIQPDIAPKINNDPIKNIPQLSFICYLISYPLQH
jgi:hypothetical protein